MKLIAILLSMGVFPHLVLAQHVIFANSKESALRACEEKAAESPKQLRDEMLESCRCVVSHIDFEKAIALSKAKQEEALQALNRRASEICIQKMNRP